MDFFQPRNKFILVMVDSVENIQIAVYNNDEIRLT